MGWRFFRRISILPGVTLNLGKKNFSFSFGPRGAKYTIGTRGSRFTAGLPGTGLFYTVTDKDMRGGNRASSSNSYEESPSLPLGFFQKFCLPKPERIFADVIYRISTGDVEGATRIVEGATGIVDGAFLAAVLFFEAKEVKKAKQYIDHVRNNISELGVYYSKYRITQKLGVTILNNEEIAYNEIDAVGVDLMYMVICDECGLHDEAIAVATRMADKIRYTDTDKLNYFIGRNITNKGNLTVEECKRILEINGYLMHKTEEKTVCELELQNLMKLALLKLIEIKVDSLKMNVAGKIDDYVSSEEEFKKGSSPLFDRINTIEQADTIIPLLGIDDVDNSVTVNFLKCQNLIIASASGAGKTNALNCILISMLYRNSPKTLKIMIIDPKGLDHERYNTLPHLLLPVVSNQSKMKISLDWASAEVDRRVELLKNCGTTNIYSYNKLTTNNDGNYLPQLVIFVDDFNIVEANYPDCIPVINKIVQFSKATGVHFILSTNNIDIKNLNMSYFLGRVALKCGSYLKINKFLSTQNKNIELDDYEAVISTLHDTSLNKCTVPLINDSDVNVMVSHWGKQDKSDLQLYKRLLPYQESQTLTADDMHSLYLSLKYH